MRIHPDLPIYHLDDIGPSILYTPGTLAVVAHRDVDRIRRIWLEADVVAKNSQIQAPMDYMVGHAQKALEARKAWLDEPFAPECLTVYLSNQCNLGCVYCFANQGNQRRLDAERGARALIDEHVFRSAAELVGQNCAEKHKPFRLVLHGGGEPTLHWGLVRRMVAISQEVASGRGVAWRGHIATNGVMPLEHAQWLGTHFQSIGLSCDGPPDIQNRQRPFPNQQSTSEQVRRTADAVRASGAHLQIRTTITPTTLDRQKEILLYLVNELGARTVRFEPVYAIHDSDINAFAPEEADHYAAQFRDALETAWTLNADLSFSGIRMEEPHGPYCDILRQTLHLTPDGRASACFFCVDGRDASYRDRIIGGYDRAVGRFRMDFDKIARLRQKSARIPNHCLDCFAAFHCARACPEICMAKESSHPFGSVDAFRCRLNYAIGKFFIQKAAWELLPSSSVQTKRSLRIPPGIRTVLREAPPPVWDAVINQWRRSTRAYHVHDRGLPQPIWKAQGFQFTGEQTWPMLRRMIAQSPPAPISMYVHIPFCDHCCAFCDCYSIATPRGHRLHDAYMHWLLGEIEHWADLGKLRRRMVTTVHFGGGTPNFLNFDHFQTLVDVFRDHFHVTRQTEWALETTVNLLTDDSMSLLWQMGFRRLHVGVQTLEEPLRTQIGRRETAAKVLDRIRACMRMGFVTSVDLLYGLPGETSAGFFQGLEQLMTAGVQGVSFYQFNPSRRNRRFTKRCGADANDIWRAYALFLAANQIMTGAGFHKNHFAHFALEADQNRYYTHTRRGEDLLALGASADGVFDGLHYRIPHLSAGILKRSAAFPALQGGVMETALERITSGLVNQLMTGSIGIDMIKSRRLEALVERWRTYGLIRPHPSKPDAFQLTGSGSWLICAMIRELKALRIEDFDTPDAFQN